MGAARPFANLSLADRDRLYNQMSWMGARAAGLVATDRDPEGAGALALRPTRGRGATPFVIGAVDQIVNGANEAGTQSETSIAVNAAGSVLIAGYNDASGFPDPSNPDQKTLSLSGVARSGDGGATWAPVLVGPGGNGTLPTVTSGSVFGDPDVKYDPTRDEFFYSSIYVRPSDGLQGMSIHHSNAGATAGTQWVGPIEVSPTFINSHSADKEFFDVNTKTGRVLVGWTDFGTATTAIKTTFSDNEGTSWSASSTISSGGATQFLQASIPRFLPAATNATSTAYIVWRNGTATTRNIGCSRSTDGGATWSVAVDIDSNAYSPEDQILGVDRIATSPSMAIDYTTGQVYVVYQRNNTVGTGDVAFRTFTGACAAGTAATLSSNPGNDRAQFMPWVTVDQSNGFVHVIWYDQAHDTSGDLLEVMHTVSKDHGATFSPPTPLVDRPFHAGYGNDTGQPNMGDYIQATAQSGKLHTTWGGTSVEPHFDEGLPARSTITPDVYWDARLDSDNVAPLRAVSAQFSEASCAALGNGNIDPGETISLTATVQNYVTNAKVGAATLSTVSGTLSTTTSGVTVIGATSSWADLAAGASGANTTPFTFSLAPSFVAGTPIDFILTMTTNSGSTQLPLRATTGTPGTATSIISEDFEAVTTPALPTGWTAQVGAGTNDPWVTSSSFAPMTGKFAFHGEGNAFEWMRLWSPVVTVPTVAGQSYVSLDFDLAYRLEDDTTKLVQAMDGLTVRVTDMTGGTALRSVLAEAFAQQLTTGSSKHFPKHLPRSSSTSYLEDMSVWSGNSNGVTHVAMRFPSVGMSGRDVQLRFEYTQDGSGTCTTSGYPTPCGIGVDNVKLLVVPLTDAHCPTADLSITKTGSPDPVTAGNAITYTLTVTNNGPSSATGVKVIDTLPAGTTFVSATGSGWTCNQAAGTVTCTLPTLASTATSTITVVATAPTMSGSITNSATVSADQFDPMTSNNSASAMTQVLGVPTCGNGAVESGEQCDDGAANGTAGDCCSASCQFSPNTTVCRAAANSCDVAETCNGAGVCPADAKAPNGTPCPDGNVCNGDETCMSGTCMAGTALSCDDGISCTTDSCDAVTGCHHVNLCVDMAMGPDMSQPVVPDLSVSAGNDLSSSGGDDLSPGGGGDDLATVGAADLAHGGGGSGGCGCRVGGTPAQRTPPLTFAMVGLFALLALRRRRVQR